MLAARVSELGFSQVELAEEINSVCHRLTGQRGYATDRYVRQLLDGTTLWPRKAYRHSLEAIFRCSALELGFIPRASKPARTGEDPSHSDEQRVRKGAPVIRRDFLRLASGTVLSVAFPDLA